MYKKALSGLLLMNLIFLFGFLCVSGVSRNRQAAVPASAVKLDERLLAQKEASTLGIARYAISEQRVIRVLELERRQEPEKALEGGMKSAGAKGDPYQLEEEELDILLRIVEAEAGNQDADGRLLVANVVLNRVRSDKFPDNVKDVVLQENGNGKCQFSPVGSGRIWRVKVSEKTSEAVGRALDGEDISEGALYFAARKYADSGNMRWFDEHLTYLFEHGGHEFYR